MPTNWYMILVAALIPLAVGSLYYSPILAGKKWMSVNGFKDEDLQGANMPLIFILTFVLSALFAFFYSGMVIHQSAIVSLLMPEALESGSEAQKVINDFMATYGDRHRNFGHGAVHGVFATIFFVLPLIAINAMFERRGWTYIMIHVIYWLICLVLMGGLLCATLQYAPLG